MNKEVTLPLVLAALIFIVMAIAGACGWSDPIPVQLRGTFKTIFWLCLPFLGACFVWHIWSTRGRPDLEPDVLSALFPSDPLLQLGACHTRLDIRQVVSRLQIVVLLQNRFDHEVQMTMRFSAEGGYETLYREIPPLEVQVSASACLIARIRQPLDLPYQEVPLALLPCGCCWPPFSANQVRFKRGDALQTEIKGWIRLLSFFAGHMVTGGARYWRVVIQPWNATEPAGGIVWECKTLWVPGTAPDVRQLTENIRSFAAS